MKMLAAGSLVLCLLAPARADVVVDAGRGPVTVRTPPGYDPAHPAPLLVLLHGWNSTGAGIETYLQFLPHAQANGWLYVAPDGQPGAFGVRDWNSQTVCCTGGVTNDSYYIAALLDAVEAAVSVDDRRVFLIGYSSGGSLGYRVACDHAGRFAAIVSLCGCVWDTIACAPTQPTHVLEIHGNADTILGYNGGWLFGNYIGAIAAVERWATYDGCSLVRNTSFPPLDIEANLAGSETTIRRYASGCQPGGSTELWTVAGGGHDPALTAEFRVRVVAFLLAHPEPDPGPWFCAGDGTATACPCGNTGAAGRGCDNSAATGGARLDASGDTALNDVILFGSGFPPNASPTVLAFRSQVREAGGSGSLFGDGLLCLASPVVRLAADFASGGTARFPLDHGAGPGTFHYQLWYRNSEPFCTADTFNLSNAMTLIWP